MKPLDQHQQEIQLNGESWQNKRLLRSIYAEFYGRIQPWIDLSLPGNIVEIGSGLGNLKAHCRRAICTDLFPNSWLDLVCDGYDLPFADQSVSNLVLFDVFHHLEAPAAFLESARRVITQKGRIILFEPYISALSHAVYGLLHHEPVAMRKPISRLKTPPQERNYYAAQGNATRLFFGNEDSESMLEGWTKRHAEAFSTCHYFLSGGYSKPALYPYRWLPLLTKIDRFLSTWSRLFGGRCLVVLEAKG